MSCFFERFRIGIIILVTSLTAFYGCKREKSAEQIYNEQASGVVMILNQYYYSVTLPTGDTFYFSDIQDGKIVNPAFSASNVQTTFSFGTGFFIDNNGTIMTNRHVVNHYIKKSDVVQYVKNLTGALVSYAQERQEEIAYQAGRIYQILNYSSQSPEYNAALKQRLQELSMDYDNAQRYITFLRRMDASNILIKCHNKLGIAYNDSFISGPQDFKECYLIRESEDENVDLAMVRLAEGVTPSGAYIFRISADEKRDKLTLDQQLYLIGYNQGIALASTTEGIKVQITSGRISQKPDNYRVMYTIPILQGSSGSPVVNSYGELVAVNFATLGGTQSFNFGIPIHQIRAFIRGI